MAVRVVPLGESCRVKGIKGVWRLVARVPRYAVWKRVSPSAAPESAGDIAEAENMFCLLWMCVIYKAWVIP